MDNTEIKYELTETGGEILVPIEALLSDGHDGKSVTELVQAQFRAASMEAGKSKARIQQDYNVDKSAYLVSWTWAE